MIRRVLIVSAILAFLVVPAAHAATSITYGNRAYTLPADAGNLSLNRDCTTGKSQANDFFDCQPLQLKEYSDAKYNLAVSVFPISRYIALKEEDESIYFQKENMENFLALLHGEKRISSFYDPNGNLLNEDRRVFEILPLGAGGRAVRDVKEIRANGKLVGYAFTPAISGGDFPPYFDFRIALIYDESTGLFFRVMHRLTTDTYESVYNYLETYGKTSGGTIDYDYYNDNPSELYTLLNQHFDTYVLPRIAAYTRTDQVAKALLESTPVQAFRDVSFTYPFLDAIEYVKDHGFVQGYEDGTYRADAPINRAEFLKILAEAHRKDSLSALNMSDCFRDVPNNAWYANYICYAKFIGVISGYPDGTFGPGRNINVAEALKIIINTYEIPLGSEGVNWFDVYWKVAEEYDMFRRLQKGPGDLLTRGDMAELIMRLENRLEVETTYME